ncbi:2OG-Fe(II) oxygenase [Hydrogenovibrio marinus]|uniref:2OG-Fe(II) oxygenase n=1 Tax=Hydrogenovibrio marinus TaxID=28885 RepID=UPI0009DDC87F|nr:2OG-Fe(II) oxygenase [Hydrogenovibrio marinus]BBN60612.1 prolyl 4-hydroxylase subunit alpha [Hydrogenovibrio marinus]
MHSSALEPDALVPFDPASPESEASINDLLDNLVEKGWYVWPNAIEPELCQALLEEASEHHQEGELKRAGIGRGDEHQLNRDIRRDKIKWLDGSTPTQQAYLAKMADLQFRLNRELFLGLFEYECHFALYQPGDFYKKHYDSFRGQATRIVTTVLYLNPEWQPGKGGELVIYKDEEDTQPTLVSPYFGTLAVFMSEEILHEVLPTLQSRYSITGWFRLNNMQGNQVDPPTQLLTY